MDIHTSLTWKKTKKKFRIRADLPDNFNNTKFWNKMIICLSIWPALRPEYRDIKSGKEKEPFSTYIWRGKEIWAEKVFKIHIKGPIYCSLCIHPRICGMSLIIRIEPILFKLMVYDGMKGDEV